jgi:hypothetical protein
LSARGEAPQLLPRRRDLVESLATSRLASPRTTLSAPSDARARAGLHTELSEPCAMPRASAASTADRDTVLADSHHLHQHTDAVATAADNEDEQLQDQDDDDDDDDDDDEQEIYGKSTRENHRQGGACVLTAQRGPQTESSSSPSTETDTLTWINWCDGLCTPTDARPRGRERESQAD